MVKVKFRWRSRQSASSSRRTTNALPFKARFLEETKNQLAKWLVRAMFAVAAATVVIPLVLSFYIPGAYVDPDGVNWTFGVGEIDKTTTITANARMPKWFGLRYRGIRTFEPNARDAVNAYLAKHKPYCSIFSINSAMANPLVPCEADLPDETTTCFVEIGGKKLMMSDLWGATVVCKR